MKNKEFLEGEYHKGPEHGWFARLTSGEIKPMPNVSGSDENAGLYAKIQAEREFGKDFKEVFYVPNPCPITGVDLACFDAIDDYFFND